MRYRFAEFELDTSQFSLRGKAGEIHVEPLVFDLLVFLVENAPGIVTRDAVIERVWGGRAIADTTVASCIKAVRKALGDSGDAQAFVRTVRGRGLQFVAEVEALRVEAQAPVAEPMARQEKALPLPTPGGRQSAPRIAVLPLYALQADARLRLIADAVAQEVILELSRLHWLFVIARGSSFQFRGQEIDHAKVGEILGVDYLLTGTILQAGKKVEIAVELSRVNDRHLVWAERFVTAIGEVMHLRQKLAGEIVGALEPRLQLFEAIEAAKVPTEHLDAWACYHRGLWHMFRFNKRDNELAAGLFERATSIDPAFARAHAGLSFTHFQNAFLGFKRDAKGEIGLARSTAERSLSLDPLDPFVNLTMGRAEWLGGNLELGQTWMERSVTLSPNYAFAIYNSALVGTMLGEGKASEAKVSKAISLSPIDPLGYAMLATRALSQWVQGDFAGAAEWSERAVKAPNSHVQIFVIAAFTHELAGDRDKARAFLSRVREVRPDYRIEDFVRSFPMSGKQRNEAETALRRLGL